MAFNLMPVITGGFTVEGEDTWNFSCLRYGGKKVATVLFKNQGIQSTITIKMGGAKIILVPGAAFTDAAPNLCYLQTEYQLDFAQSSGPAVAKNELFVLIQTYDNGQ